jgi:hypothetical protein
MGSGPKSTASHCWSVAVARDTMRSLNANEIAATAKLARTKGARIWCADSPPAFIEMTSLFWLSVDRVMMVPSSTEKGRKRAMICGVRRLT